MILFPWVNSSSLMTKVILLYRLISIAELNFPVGLRDQTYITHNFYKKKRKTFIYTFLPSQVKQQLC